MRKVQFAISKESTGDMIKAGRFNPSLEITFRDKTGIHNHKIGAGTSDDIYAYREQKTTFVLMQNRHLDYLDLVLFEGSEKKADIYIDGDHTRSLLGKNGLAPFTIIRRLLPWL